MNSKPKSANALSYCIMLCLILLLNSGLGFAQVPHVINYQGRILVKGSNFNGAGELKFALIDESGTVTYWSNDGTSTNGYQPESATPIEVSGGIYTISLGDTALDNMVEIPPKVFSNNGIFLRVWFNDGIHGFEQLEPDLKITSVAYAMVADGVRPGGITSDMIADGAIDSDKLNFTCVDIINSSLYEDENRNIGIGTNSPSSKLDVVGNINTNFSYLIGGKGVMSIDNSGSTLIGTNVGANSSETNSLSITKEGNIGIGTTDPYAYSRLTVNNSWGDWIFFRQDQPSNGGGYHIHNPWKNTGDESGNRLEVAYQPFESQTKWGQFVLHGPTGNIGIGTTTPFSKLSLGKTLGKTTLAMYETSEDYAYGFGIEVGLFRLHLGNENARFGFFNAKNGEEVVTITGKGRTKTKILEITGGSDLSEHFEIEEKKSKIKPVPGMVVSIDPEAEGDLIVSKEQYDRRVAGIISGAGGIRSGMLMGQKGSIADGTIPVALSGRVYCWADASNGAIEPGDLLVTSNRPGHAMRVADYAKAQGAVLGKAMGSLSSGQGLILVLVALQ